MSGDNTTYNERFDDICIQYLSSNLDDYNRR